jgi:hypothetical protein
MIEQSLEYLETIVYALENNSVDINKEYIEELKLFIDKFRYYKPAVYIHVSGGSVQNIVSNCNTLVHLFDEDNEEEKENYKDLLEEWEFIIQAGLNSGILKNVF